MDSHRLNFFTLLHDHPHRHRWVSFFLVSGLLLIATLVFGWLIQLPENTIAPGVSVGSVRLAGRDRSQAEAELLNQWQSLPEASITIHHEGKSWQKSSQELGLHLDASKTVEQALAVGRSGTVWNQIQNRVLNHFRPTTITPIFAYESNSVSQWVQDVSTEVDIEGRIPHAKIVAGRTVIDAGKLGQKLDQKQLSEEIQTNPGQSQEITAPVEVTTIPLSADALIAAEKRLALLRPLKIVLKPSDEEKPVTLSAVNFFPWLRLPDGYYTNLLSAGLTEHTQSWNREPQEVVFELNESKTKVKNFVPPRAGRAVALDILVDQMETAITQFETSEATPGNTVTLSVPFQEITVSASLEEANTLGIRERIGVATSEFAGSIPNRIHNVQLTANNLHGTIIKPDEEFSFNAAIGDVSQATGYKQAYIIQNGRTELGDGGGVCQVSTTLFRSVLNAGLPITRWKPHSYRVGYYEQNSEPGFDATVYAPSTDLRFKNDTGHSIVVAAYLDTKNTFLKIELWGTSDGRTANISDYRIWNQQPAPAPLFVPDPSIPVGSRKQIDWAAPGASTKFTYTATNANGEIIQKREFISNFRPWQAVYLVNPSSMP